MRGFGRIGSEVRKTEPAGDTSFSVGVKKRTSERDGKRTASSCGVVGSLPSSPPLERDSPQIMYNLVANGEETVKKLGFGTTCSCFLSSSTSDCSNLKV